VAHPHGKRIEYAWIESILQALVEPTHLAEIRPRFLRLQRGRPAQEAPPPQIGALTERIRKTIQVPIRDAAFLHFRTDVDLDEDILNDFLRLRSTVEQTRKVFPIHRFNEVDKTADIILSYSSAVVQ
jgi:hypothetical protein